MNTTTKAIAGMFLLLVGGCGSVPNYRAYDGSMGFSDAPIGGLSYEVTYTGSGSLSPSNATWFATCRAAEIAFESGKPFFELTTRDRTFITETNTNYGYTTMDQHMDRRNGRVVTSVLTSPNVTTTTNRPVVTLEVKLLDVAGERSMETESVLKDAIARGVAFGPAVTARYGLPVPKK